MHALLLDIARPVLLLMSIGGWVGAFTFVMCKVADSRQPTNHGKDSK